MEDVEAEENGDNTDDDDDDSDSEEQMDEEVQIDFEARIPEDCDAGGIRTLLQQVFLKAHVDVSELTDTIISQNYIGSVMKQPYSPEDDDEEEDDADIAEDSVLALTSVLNLTERKDLECVKQLKTMLQDKCRACAADKADKFAKILNDPDKQVGYLISERFLNLPPNLAVPMFEALQKEMVKACGKGMKYSFSHYLMICKTFEMKTAHNQKQMFFSNSEEELFQDESEFGFNYSVEHERDEGVEKWSSEDGMKPYRTVLLFDANKLETVLQNIKDELNKT